MSLIRYSVPRLASSSRHPSSWVNEVDRLFDLAFPVAPQTRAAGWVPPLDLWEQGDQFVVRLELPGLKKEEVQLSLHEGVLTVKGERKHAFTSKPGETFRSERSYGSFSRNVALPAQVNHEAVTAAFKDGVLTVTLPKAESAKPRQITVSAD